MPQLEAQLRDLEQQYRDSGFDDVEYSTWTPGETLVGGRGIEKVGSAVAMGGSPAGLKATGIEFDIALTAASVLQLGKTLLSKTLIKARSSTAKEVFIDFERYPQSAQHLEDAGALNRPLPVNRRAAAANRVEALRGKPKVPGMDLDEAPPAVLRNTVRPELCSDAA